MPVNINEIPFNTSLQAGQAGQAGQAPGQGEKVKNKNKKKSRENFNPSLRRVKPGW